MNQYLIPVAVGVCSIALFLAASFYGIISLSHRGSGRAIATEPEEKIIPGDGRRLYDWGKERNRTYPHEQI